MAISPQGWNERVSGAPMLRPPLPHVSYACQLKWIPNALSIAARSRARDSGASDSSRLTRLRAAKGVKEPGATEQARRVRFPARKAPAFASARDTSLPADHLDIDDLVQRSAFITRLGGDASMRVSRTRVE